MFQNLYNDMLTDYREQSQLISDEEKEETKPKKLIEHPSELTDRALSFFDSKFIWESGEYLMKINVLTSDGEANISKEYRFTIYESQTERQKELTKKYKFGDGIWCDLKGSDSSIILSIKEA